MNMIRRLQARAHIWLATSADRGASTVETALVAAGLAALAISVLGAISLLVNEQIASLGGE